MNIIGRWVLCVALPLTVFAAESSRTVKAAFTPERTEQSWTLAELNHELPTDWTGYEYLVLEFKASSSQRFDLGIDTEKGRVSKRIGPYARVWVRASIPLRFYREPAGSAVDLAATYNQPRASYWINISGKTSKTATIGVRGLSVAMSHPAGAPTVEIRAVSLAKNDVGDAVLEGKPLIDEFGQYTHAEWPGKAHSLEELKQAWAVEEAAIKQPLADHCEYGGFASTHAKATGYFRVEQVDGRWWFVCPDGHLFFSTGLNGVGFASATRVQGREDIFATLPPRDLISQPAGAPRRPGRTGFMGGSFYTWNLQRRFGPDWRSKWPDFTAHRLAAWGFNSIHYWGPRNVELGAEPQTPYAQMLRGWQTDGSIMGMPDVYADDFSHRVDEAAASQLEPRKNDKWMLGYFIGNEPPWPGRESQLVDLVLTGPDGPMKQRLQAHLAEADTPERRREFVYAAFARYLEVIAAACKQHDPNHLNLGIRFGGSPHDELVKLMRDRCDVFSINIYRYAPERKTLDRCYELAGRPMLIGEFHIGAPERGMASGLVQAANQEERGVAYRYYVEHAAAHPALIGTHWFQWLDQPVTGRNDGENYNIGFVDVSDQPYAELVAAAKVTHARLLAVHRGELPPVDRRARAAENEPPPAKAD